MNSKKLLSLWGLTCQVSALLPSRSRIAATSREIAASPSRNRQAALVFPSPIKHCVLSKGEVETRIGIT